jgi:glyoxylase-like metal-dependent hydrolase (beta-lactamase superfamily II)
VSRSWTPASPAAAPCRVDRDAADGDPIDILGGARVVAVPGHTPGSIAVHLPAHRVLLTGDTIAEAGGRAILGPFNTDRPRAWASLRRQAALDIDLACVGHGDPLPVTALRAATDPLG